MTATAPALPKLDLSPVSLSRRPATRLAQLLAGLWLYGTSMAFLVARAWASTRGTCYTKGWRSDWGAASVRSPR